MKIRSYKDLVVWQKSMDLVVEIYRLTRELPKEELYGLVSQMRRCVVSIVSSIAEGQKRKHIGEYIQFLNIANASTAELETQLIIVERIYPHVKVEKVQQMLNEIQRMLTTLIQRLEGR